MVATLAQNTKPKLAVIKQQSSTDTCCSNNLGVWQIDPTTIAGSRVQIKLKFLASLQLDALPLELPEPKLRSLHIGQDPDRAANSMLKCPDHLDAFRVIGVRPMAKIESEYVGTCLGQLRQHLRCGAGWADRRDDFCAPMAA
jgi:hypothetical protein